MYLEMLDQDGNVVDISVPQFITPYLERGKRGISGRGIQKKGTAPDGVRTLYIDI